MMYGGFNQFCNSLFSFGRFSYGGSIIMIIGIVLLAVILFFVFRKNGFSNHTSERETPLDVLQKRYVNGDISKEEYVEKKDILKG
jgi:putative membrane protein